MHLSIWARAGVLLITLTAFALIPFWRRHDFPQPAPQGFGVAIGYGLGGVRELDTLGPVWYMNYDSAPAPLGNHPHFLLVNTGSELHDLSGAARANRGAWWQFGNEPNDPNQDNVSPDDYARAYHRFYFTLKQADPAAQIVPAGIANVDWQWADAFLKAYQRDFGTYPKVDGWNIHNYLLDTCPDALNADRFKQRIVAFRAWMARSDQADKPLFLTEYGVLYGNGCCSCPVIPDSGVVDFMRTTSRWLETSRTVTAWAWFAVNTYNRFNGDLFDDSARLTPFGEAYRDLVAGASGRR
jgi:hypothetical protein